MRPDNILHLEAIILEAQDLNQSRNIERRYRWRCAWHKLFGYWPSTNVFNSRHRFRRVGRSL